jgi:NADPH:quinone reductase
MAHRRTRLRSSGGPEVLALRGVEDPTGTTADPQRRRGCGGVHYRNPHQNGHSYAAPAELPLIPGLEVAGTTPDRRRVFSLLPHHGGCAEKSLGIEALISPWKAEGI